MTLGPAPLSPRRRGRARGWVLSQGVAIYAYCTTENNPILHREAGSRLDLVLSELE